MTGQRQAYTSIEAGHEDICIVENRAEITRKMERLLLEDFPDDRGYYWKSSMGYWNRVQNWPPLLDTTVYNYGKFEQVWCQGGRCM